MLHVLARRVVVGGSYEIQPCRSGDALNLGKLVRPIAVNGVSVQVALDPLGARPHAANGYCNGASFGGDPVRAQQDCPSPGGQVALQVAWGCVVPPQEEFLARRSAPATDA